MNATLDIIIVNWNAGRQLRACLESLAAVGRDGVHLCRIVVVDNASTDDSLDEIADLDLPLHTIRNSQNHGFGAAANQGAQGSQADYLLFLNPDTRLHEASLSAPIAYMQQPTSKHTGIVGVQLIGDNNIVSRTCCRIPKPRHFWARLLGLSRLAPGHFPSHFMAEWDHLESRSVGHVMGSFYLARRALFEQLGGFDERFFMYLEDLDFSLRAQQAGWTSFYLTEAQVYHEGGGTSKQIKARRLFYSLRSRILYGFKHFSRPAALALALGTLTIEPLTRTIFTLARGAPAETFQVWRAYLMLWLTTIKWVAGR
jgi:N-acetylglucosaminyl-diphospho-decaprenol L-rhamnosyltransferase